MIFIPGNTPSSKNGKVWTGRYFVVNKQTAAWTKATDSTWEKEKDNFLELVKCMGKPYIVKFKFIRGSRRKFDYVNPLQTVQDAMVKHGWINDDNMTEILPVFLPYEYNKEEPGVWISV